MSAVALPTRLEAHEPPEARGVPRDQRPPARLLSQYAAASSTAAFVTCRSSSLPAISSSSTRRPRSRRPCLRRAPTAAELELRFSTPAPGRDPDRYWIVELRRGDEPFGAVEVGEELVLPAAATARILAPYAAPRLWLAHVDLPQPLETYLTEHGQPIRYGYVPQHWPLSAYRNVYAAEPGSAEMPSAGRPFTPELITRLIAGGVLVAPITLHTGVSSQERHEPPYPERFRVPRHTASLVNAVHEWGGRVIAVGTTVVRALETVSQPDGTVAADDGWTNLVVTPERGLWAIDGLLTGLHEPESSHLEMLLAAVGHGLLERSYEVALEHGYRWHEFGDSHLILP